MIKHNKTRVRFHLAKGCNYKKWQIKNGSSTIYLDPNQYCLELINCKLVNEKGKARKIHEGSNKDVCAWIDCDRVIFWAKDEVKINTKETNRLFYDPRVRPFWYDTSNSNCDDLRFESLLTKNKRLYAV